MLMHDLDAMHFQRVQAIQPGRTIVLDLTPDEDTLLANMKEKWRYNIRLAGRKGVQIRVAETVEDVQHWYGLLQTTSIRDRFGIHTLEYYRRAWQIFAPRDQARLLLAQYNGQLLAGIFVGLMAKQAFTFMALRVMNSANSCLIICCNGRLFAGRNKQVRIRMTSGVFPKQTSRARQWQAFTALKADGAGVLCAFLAIMNAYIIPRLCAL